MTKKKTPAARKRGRPADKLTRRFMVRCSEEQFARWAREAAKRGFQRGNDSGVGRLAGIELDRVTKPTGILRRSAPAVAVYDPDREYMNGDGEIVQHMPKVSP